MARQAAQPWEDKLQAMAESGQAKDDEAVRLILQIGLEKVTALKQDSYLQGQLKRSLAVVNVAQQGDGIALNLPLLLASTTFAKNEEEMRQQARADLALLLKDTVSALERRHLVSLNTEIRLDFYGASGRIKDVVEKGYFDLPRLREYLKSNGIGPGQPVEKEVLASFYQATESHWEKYKLNRVKNR